ncbi:hypothetical protein EDB81DRAFT_850758 [Dactylonectria macrodidyma]|uniref:Uncharacterized protein n=1 Tax=Dactylonectria macrodidyma TaxID=307937 RepID=A0A9P9FX61_9HYPO|nr:hypothetical protein EDB81DRAFT_850758 [Dactylonectria macrodidyma]
MSSRGFRSRSREPQTGGLDNFRVLDQSQRDPFDTPVIPQSSRTFRVTAFVFHLGLSLLESPRSREALYQMISKTYQVSPYRTRRTFIWTGNLQTDRERTHQLVDSFLSKCRTDPPNITVSDRITGEGVAIRLDWPGFLGARDPSVYSPKWAATFRINKMLVDAAVRVAEAGNVESLQRYLFLLSLSVAHELVHMLMGYMFGSSDTDTPPLINYPPGGANSPRGESGRYWERAVFGYFIESYFDSRSSMGANQSGILYGVLDGRRFVPIESATIQRLLRLDFSQPIITPNQRTQRILQGAIPMQDIRRPSGLPDYRGDLTSYFQEVNALPSQRVGRDALAQIMQMANEPRFIRPPPIPVSSRSRR